LLQNILIDLIPINNDNSITLRLHNNSIFDVYPNNQIKEFIKNTSKDFSFQILSVNYSDHTLMDIEIRPKVKLDEFLENTSIIEGELINDIIEINQIITLLNFNQKKKYICQSYPK
jgi:hypothetical protein